MKLIKNHVKAVKGALYLGGVKDNANNLKTLAKGLKALDDSKGSLGNFDDLHKVGITEEHLTKAKRVCYRMSIFAFL